MPFICGSGGGGGGVRMVWELLHITKFFFWFFILTCKNNSLRGAFLVILWLKIVLWYFLSISWNKLCFTTRDIFLYLKGFYFRKQIIRQRLVKGTLIFVVILQEGINRGMGRPLILHPLQWWGNLFLVNLFLRKSSEAREQRNRDRASLEEHEVSASDSP